EQMEHPVRRAARRCDARHRMQERAPIEEPARRRWQSCRELAGAPRRIALLFSRIGGNEAVADDGDPEAVERDRHRVRAEMARARPGTRARDALELVDRGTRAGDRLPDVLDRDAARPRAPRAAV